VQKERAGKTPETYVYMNGEIILSKDARLSIWDRGLIYGDGFFTTMRAEKGRVFFLAEHLKRLKGSCALFRIRFPEQLHQKDIYTEILSLNGLNNRCAMMKIIITRGEEQGLGLPYGNEPTYIIIAKPYEPPHERYQQGWHLVSFHIPRSCLLSAHKSLNYLYNMWAKHYALEQGADDAILIGHDGLVKETSVGSIIFQRHGRWFTPQGEDILPGITLNMLSKLWEIKGISIERKATCFNDLINADQVWVLNSLIGIIPVRKINEHILEPAGDWRFANESRQWLWEYAIYERF